MNARVRGMIKATNQCHMENEPIICLCDFQQSNFCIVIDVTVPRYNIF
jgi:hypothetical protein